jgi:alanine racemase
MSEVDARVGRWVEARIDLDAVMHNVGVLRSIAAPAAVWAVVKADGYGHGAVPAARAAMAAGAEGLCVALAQEGVELRNAGIDAPILLLSEQPLVQLDAVVANRLVPTVYSERAVVAVAEAVRRAGRVGYPIQVKVDTGMNRVGVPPEQAASLVAAIAATAPTLRLAGVFTHLAVSDEPEHPFTTEQIGRFDEVLSSLPNRPPVVHAANSGGALAHPSTRYDLVRPGITLYGIEPGTGVHDHCAELRPALSLVSRVSWVKRVRPGDRISYGLTHTFERETTVATVPIGYADGVPRRLGNAKGLVLLGGKRRDITGMVTMDQLMLDCGDDPVEIGDEVVLIGAQGADCVRAEEWAAHLGTIPYEIVCNLSKRVRRVYLGGPSPALGSIVKP